LILAAVGIYGVMSYSVSRRTREIGIRMSLGASRPDVLRMVLQQGMLQAVCGTAVGVAGARALSKLHLPATVVFVAVAGEEQGLNGSSHLAKLARSEGWQLEAVLNNDIVGGNSGSPLIDAEGRMVGLVFDGNIDSIAGAYWFDPANNRAIAVHPAIIREALEQVYGAKALLAELGAS